MTRIRKSYFTLEELASEWGLPEADLQYVAENGPLTLPVRVVGILAYFEPDRISQKGIEVGNGVD